MADNISVKDGAGASVVVGSKEVSSVQWPGHHIVDPTTPTQKMAVDSSSRASVHIAAAAAAIAKAEDVASADADVGVPAMAVRKATPANVSGTDGDYEFLQVSAGRLWISGILTALQGAANINTAVVATSTTAGTAAIARATRRSLTIKNVDAAITVYIGPATVSAANGMPLLFGESITVTWVGLVQVIAASGTPNIAILDEYD